MVTVNYKMGFADASLLKTAVEFYAASMRDLAQVESNPRESHEKRAESAKAYALLEKMSA